MPVLMGFSVSVIWILVSTANETVFASLSNRETSDIVGEFTA